MKKFIVFMTSIITIMIIVASPIMSLRTIAAVTLSEGSPIEAEYAECPHTDDKFTSVQAFVNYNSINNENTYYYYLKYGGADAKSIFVYFTSADVTFDNNVLVISNPNYSGRSSEISYAVYYSNGNRNTYNNPISYFEIDYTNHTCRYKFSGGYSDQYGISNANWYYSETNYTDILSPGGLNVSVDFTPDLSDLVVRGNVSDNGVNASSKYFSMDITNNSKTGIQYYFAIQDYPTNYSDLSTYSPQPESGIHAAHANTSQSFCNEEWIFIHPLASQGIVKVLKLSEWHYLASGESFHQNFSWSQFNLERGKQYQALVIAVPNDIGCASALTNYHQYAYLSQPDVEPYVIDMSAAEVVHFSNFSIANPVAFDRDNTDFGNYISTGDKVVPQYDTKAYEDPKTGSVVIANRKTSGEDFQDITGKPVVGGSHGGGGYYTGSSNYSGSYNNYSNSFGSLNGYFSAYFGFISTIIGFFPSPFQVILTIGMCGLVVIGILKVAIK